MSVNYNTSFFTRIPDLLLDAANKKSYSGSGTTWNDLSSYKSIYSSTSGTYPSWSSKYFTFINNGTVTNTIVSSTQNLTTYSQLVYTRIAWIYPTAYSGAWSPVICNQIGNNNDMCLGLNSSGNILFHQYTTTNDYSLTGNVVVPLNTWSQIAMVVNRSSSTINFYFNGTLDATVSTTTIGNSASDTIVIGGAYTDSYGGGRMFKGNISLVMHYNGLLSNGDIRNNFNAFRGRYGL